MADEQDRTFSPSQTETNRGRSQGLGVGQQEMNQQRDPNRFQTATNPEQRSFDGDLDDATNADRPTQADFGDGSTDGEDAGQGSGEAPSRNAMGINDIEGDLGAGTPANVDIHKLGQTDNPQEEWGEPAGEGAVFSSNHSRRAEKTEAERGQGAKTRAANKDQISRRG
jgi:hypothetical protein